MLPNFKKFIILSLMLLLTNCASPGAALLSPAVTGWKTKSAHQASLSLVSSLSSNKIMRIHSERVRIRMMEKRKKIFDYLNQIHKKT